MEKTTETLRKYIDFLSYDHPHNSLPFLIYAMIFITVNFNFLIAVKIEHDNVEKFLSAMVDFVMNVLIFSCFIRRGLDKRESLQLLDVIEDKVELNRQGFADKDSGWEIIENTQEKKRENAARMSKNLYIVLLLLGSLMVTRNIIKSMLGMYEVSKLKSIRWPTPYLSYFSPKFDHVHFFIFFYILQAVVVILTTLEGVLIFNSFYLITEKILTDFEIFYILLNSIVEESPDASSVIDDESLKKFDVDDIVCLNRGKICKAHLSTDMKLRKDMRCIVALHQKIIRNFRICSYNSANMLSIANFLVLIYGCTFAYLMLASNDPKKTVHYAMFFILMNFVSFSAYNNGQRIFNQNNILRRTLSELPWTDKPHWFKQTLHIMMTRANVDIEMRPHGIYSLNYMSFKELMKTVYSVGNIFRKYDLQ